MNIVLHPITKMQYSVEVEPLSKNCQLKRYTVDPFLRTH